MAEAGPKSIENVIDLIQRLQDRVDQRFDDLDRRFESVENRLDRVNDTLASVQTQMGAMTRWADRFDREHTALAQTQVAQQRAIDDLATRLTRLERRAS